MAVDYDVGWGRKVRQGRLWGRMYSVGWGQIR